MNHPKMAVLWALAGGPKSGYEIEILVRERNIRAFSCVGMSSIYKACKDMERNGFIVGRRARARRGPGKSVYAITNPGREAFAGLIDQAAMGGGVGPSERIAGAMFAEELPGGGRRLAVRRALRTLDAEIAALELEAEAGDVISDFRHACLKAERHALRRLLGSA